MLNHQAQVPRSQTVRLRDFGGGFTDWRCGCPPNYFTEIENFDVLFDKSICTRTGSQMWGICNISNRVERLDCLKGTIYSFSADKLFKHGADGVCEEIIGCSAQTGQANSLFPLSDEDTCSDSAYWQGHMYITNDACDKPVKVFCDEFDNTVAVTAGLPQIVETDIVSAETIGNGGGQAECNYIYAFFWCYEYTDNCGVTYLDNGPVTYYVHDYNDPVNNPQNMSRCIGEGTPGDVNRFTLSAFGLDNTDGDNYCLSDVRVKVYRTENNGTTFFFVGDAPLNGPILDDIPDEELVNNQVIYNQGSTISYDPPPNAKYIEIVGEVAWYANGKDDGVKLNNRLWQSIPADPDTVPGDFYIEFDGEINGLSHYDDFPIVSVITNEGKCDLYRIEGVLDEFGRNIIQQRKIGNQLGAINNNSFVRTRKGLYFFGTDGVYVTNGYTIEKLSSKWDETYCKITETDLQKKRVYGTYDKKKDKIYWGVINCPGETRTNRILVYDVDQSAFTWYSNGECFTASSMIVKDDQLYRGDEEGVIHRHEENIYTDDVFYNEETQEFENNGRKKAIDFCLKTIDIDFDLCDVNKWWDKISFQSKPKTDQSFRIFHYFNGCATPKELKCVTFEYGEGWCTSGMPWCQRGKDWCVVSECDMFKTRKFGCGRKRSRSKQIEIKPKKDVLYCSEAGSGDTLTFFGEGTNTFVQVGGAITESNIGDELVICGQVMEIIRAGSQGATQGFILAGNLFELTAGLKDFGIPYDDFTIQGIPKNQQFCLSCITLTYCVLDDSGGEFCSTEVTGKQAV